MIRIIAEILEIHMTLSSTGIIGLAVLIVSAIDFIIIVAISSVFEQGIWTVWLLMTAVGHSIYGICYLATYVKKNRERLLIIKGLLYCMLFSHTILTFFSSLFVYFFVSFTDFSFYIVLAHSILQLLAIGSLVFSVREIIYDSAEPRISVEEKRVPDIDL
jgi:hypothetical protein